MLRRYGLSLRKAYLSAGQMIHKVAIMSYLMITATAKITDMRAALALMFSGATEICNWQFTYKEHCQIAVSLGWLQ